MDKELVSDSLLKLLKETEYSKKRRNKIFHKKRVYNDGFKPCPRAINRVLEQYTLCQYTKCGQTTKIYQIFHPDIEITRKKN